MEKCTRTILIASLSGDTSDFIEKISEFGRKKDGKELK